MPDSGADLPSPAQYVQALTTLDSQISDRQRQLLVEHYLCSNHTATASELAQQIGVKSYGAINLLYGRLGSLLRDEMGYGGEGQKSAVIASFSKTGGANGDEWEWQMHEPLAAALEQLGWVPRTGPTEPRR